MRIILLGVPGAGKGTQGAILSKKLGLPIISTGDMLREAIASKSEVGLAVEAIIARGELVNDALMIQIIESRLSHNDCNEGFLLDGFPRTIAQADALQGIGVDLDMAIYLHAGDDEIVERISGRLVDTVSGRVYHKKYQPPKVPGIDDESGRTLVQREDDQETTVRHRLLVYRRQTEPLIEYYQARCSDKFKFARIDASLPLDEVTAQMLNEVEKMHESE